MHNISLSERENPAGRIGSAGALTAFLKDQISVGVPHGRVSCASGLRVKLAPMRWPSRANLESINVAYLDDDPTFGEHHHT